MLTSYRLGESCVHFYIEYSIPTGCFCMRKCYRTSISTCRYLKCKNHSKNHTNLIRGIKKCIYFENNFCSKIIRHNCYCFFGHITLIHP